MRVVKTSMPPAAVEAFSSRERDPRSLRPPDPVPLHRQNLLGPFGQAIGGLEQLVGVLGDAEEPLVELTNGDRRPAAPAAAVHHLLVGENRLAARAPVDVGAPLVGDVALQHLQEQPLVPVVVGRQAGGDLALPGVADADALQLPLHVRDVLERPFLGMRAVLDRGILGRQAERVPAERMQHVEAEHPLHARDDVANHVVADVPDVGVPRRVGKHLEAVVLRPGGVLRHFERAGIGPAFLPLLLYRLGLVIGHDPLIIAALPVIPGEASRSLPAEAGSHAS